MKDSTLEIQHLVDFNKVDGSADLTKEQRNLVVSKIIKEVDPDYLLETLIERHQPDELPHLVSQLYSAKDDSDLLCIAKKLQNMSQKTLDYYYDDKINDVISEHNWSKFETRLDEITLSSREDALQDIETPYGAKFTLGGV